MVRTMLGAQPVFSALEILVEKSAEEFRTRDFLVDKSLGSSWIILDS